MKDTLVEGLRHAASIPVTGALTVPALPSDLGITTPMPSVFATAMLVAFVEGTCIALLAPHLEDGEASLGIHVDLSHDGPTPIGGTVTASVTLAEVAGRSLWFDVEVTDEAGTVSRGRHRRAVVARERFDAGVAAHPANG